MRRLRIFISLILPSLLALIVFGQPACGGPVMMQGPVTQRTATLWLQGDDAAQVRVEYWPQDQTSQSRQTGVSDLTAQQDYTARLNLTGLDPGKTYRYRVMRGNRTVKQGHFTTLPAWRGSSQPFDFTVYFGTCAFLNDPEWDRGPPYGGEEGIFDQIAQAADRNPLPNFMLWGGDTVYYREADYESPWGMNARQRSVRHHPALQKLLTALPHYAIWDDHDYGPNDSNQSFVFKQASLELFQRYWANLSFGLPGEPGIFTAFSVADADFFLLDDRWYRDQDRSPDFPGKQLYGADQLRWLKNALLASRARFKLIVGGSQFLDEGSSAEGWHHFPAERQEFLGWLKANRISSVLFLSGDRHHTELLQRERADSYPLYELTCSPLTSRPRKAESAAKPQRVAGTLVDKRNFCTLDFAGENSDRSLTLRSFDSAGKQLWEMRVSAEELKSR